MLPKSFRSFTAEVEGRMTGASRSSVRELCSPPSPPGLLNQVVLCTLHLSFVKPERKNALAFYVRPKGKSLSTKSATNPMNAIMEKSSRFAENSATMVTPTVHVGPSEHFTEFFVQYLRVIATPYVHLNVSLFHYSISVPCTTR